MAREENEHLIARPGLLGQPPELALDIGSDGPQVRFALIFRQTDDVAGIEFEFLQEHLLHQCYVVDRSAELIGTCQMIIFRATDEQGESSLALHFLWSGRLLTLPDRDGFLCLCRRQGRRLGIGYGPIASRESGQDARDRAAEEDGQNGACFQGPGKKHRCLHPPGEFQCHRVVQRGVPIGVNLRNGMQENRGFTDVSRFLAYGP